MLNVHVFAAGTATCVYKRKEEGKEGTNNQPWETDVTEICDTVQFKVEDAASGSVIAVWAIPGDGKFGKPQAASLNYECPLFKVTQGGGVGLLDRQPPVVTTAEGIDPTFALAVAHLSTQQFSVSEIKKAFRPDFPLDPTSGLGLLQDQPEEWEPVQKV